MKQNRKIAITGGIGSGKSTVASLIKAKGYPVFSCDEIYRKLCLEEEYLKKLGDLFPDCVVGNAVDKKKLADIVFSDPDRLQQLNALAHPLIMRELINQMQLHEVSFAEVPLLFEGGYEELFDDVIYVKRDLNVRIRAVMARDGCSQEDVLARIERQFQEKNLAEKRCIVIENNQDEISLAKIVDEVLKQLTD